MISIYDVLKASKGIHVDDTFAELWGRKLSNAYTVATYIGTLPATLTGTKAGYLESYKIYGNTAQDGTPTPENPIMPSGAGERTENLFDAATVYGSMYDSATGVLVGAASVLTTIRNSFASSMVGVPITISIHADDVPVTRVYIRCTIGGTNIDSNAIASGRTGTMTVTVTPTSVNDDWRITFGTGTGNLTLSSIMLNLGSTALPYEPYGYKLPLTVNGVEYPIYLGEVETTRKVKKLVLTGEETWYFFNLGEVVWQFYTNNIISGLASSSCMSNIAEYGVTGNTRVDYDYGAYLVLSGRGVAFQMRGSKDTFVDVDAWKVYLAQQYAAGTPVTVWYILAEPETGIVNEPLMKIGDYADTVSMEQAGVSIPTAPGETTISWAGEGLAPSEVELTYRKPKGQ